MLGVVVAVVAALLVIGAVVTYRMARSNDTVESFRRQIDALSPEARRGTVDQVNRIDDTAIDDTAIDDPAVDDTSIDDTAIDDTEDRRDHCRRPPDADTADQPDDEHGS